MIFRASRKSGGDDRFLEVKAIVLVTGAALGVAGMITERDWLVYTAIAIVAVGLILRLLKQRRDG